MIDRRSLLYIITIVILLLFGLMSLAFPVMSNTVDHAFTPDLNATVDARLTAIARQERLGLTATAIIATAVGQALNGTAIAQITREAEIVLALSETARPAQTLIAGLNAEQTRTVIAGLTGTATVSAAGTKTAAPLATATAEAIIAAAATNRATLDFPAMTQTAQVTATHAAEATLSASATLFAMQRARLESAGKIESGSAPSLELLAILRHEGPALTMDFSSDERRAAAAHEGSVLLWEVNAAKVLARLEHGVPVVALRFSPDGSRLLAATSDGAIWLWDGYTGVLIGTARVHADTVFGVSFSPDGRLFASAGADRAVIWDAARIEPLAYLPSGWTWNVQFSAGGRYVITSGGDGGVRVWGVPGR